jgi:hypothetical protein
VNFAGTNRPGCDRDLKEFDDKPGAIARAHKTTKKAARQKM